MCISPVLSEAEGIDGRVYHIFFTATESLGVSCQGVARVAVSHDLGGGIDAIDGGPLYDSTQP